MYESHARIHSSHKTQEHIKPQAFNKYVLLASNEPNKYITLANGRASSMFGDGILADHQGRLSGAYPSYM